MKGQLVKRQDRWDLYNESDGSKIASTLPNPMGKLSIKNCKAIENGYDLDELCEKYATNPMSNFAKNGHEYVAKHSFGRGFQKAMELMEGKKYSEMDLMKAYKDGKTSMIKPHRLNMYEYEKSLQTKEWEVNIEVECCGNYSPCNINCEYGSKLKLDKDGCLILKRM